MNFPVHSSVLCWRILDDTSWEERIKLRGKRFSLYLPWQAQDLFTATGTFLEIFLFLSPFSVGSSHLLSDEAGYLGISSLFLKFQKHHEWPGIWDREGQKLTGSEFRRGHHCGHLGFNSARGTVRDSIFLARSRESGGTYPLFSAPQESKIVSGGINSSPFLAYLGMGRACPTDRGSPYMKREIHAWEWNPLAWEGNRVPMLQETKATGRGQGILNVLELSVSEYCQKWGSWTYVLSSYNSSF
jgi:hypothetical protein